MRSCVAAVVSLALALPPRVSHAGSWTPEQDAAMKQILDLRNESRDDEAVALARQEFAKPGTSKGYRRAVAREGKVAAENVFLRDRSRPEQTAAANTALCVAVEFMRVYAAELIESELDQLKIPAELARLQTLATRSGAPCAPPLATPPASFPSSVRPQAASRPRLPRVRIAAGSGLVVLGTGLLAGMTGVFVARRAEDDRIAALDALATQENRELTSDELADVDRWDARYARLDNAGKVLGIVAGVSLLAAILVFTVPPRRGGSHARVRPAGAGIRFAF